MNRSRRLYLMAGGLLIGAVLGVALFADYVTPVSPHYWDARSSILDGTPPFPPEPGHPLGTDMYGRDIWSRVAYGARWSLLFAFLIMAARLALALPIAIAAAYGNRRLSWLVDRLYVLFSAVPPLLIYLLVLSPTPLRLVGLWPSVVITISLLTLVEWPRLAVMVKGRIEQLSTEPFVEGAVAAGGTPWHIFFSHLVPHLWPTLLHLVAAEMGRALSVIAQLGIFGILVGGGVINIIDHRGHDRWILTTGVPEWGNMLSEGRIYILSNPWIPLPPAFAFLTGVVGFNLLSQGLEGLVVPTNRWREATTGRLHRRWRWALALLPAAAALWYWQGLPGDQEQAIAALARQQAAALNERNVDGYLATVRPATPSGLPDYRLWAESLAGSAFEAVSVAASNIEVKGHTASARWELVVGYRDRKPVAVTQETHLERRWGRWYETGEPYTTIRSYHADVDAVYDPVSTSDEAVSLRQKVQYLATSIDHAYEKALPLFAGHEQGERLRVRLYPSDLAFHVAVGNAAPANAGAWYVPGEPLRLSPYYLKGYKRWEMEQGLAYEMLKFLSYTRLGLNSVNPLVLGAFELQTAEPGSNYRVDVYSMAGERLLTLPELFAVRSEELQGPRQNMYVAQSAVLAQWLQARLPEADLTSQAPGKAWDLAALAGPLSMSPEQVAAEYDRYLYDRLAQESILTAPAARERVPEPLLAALEARCRSLETGDVAGCRATLLDWDEKDGNAYVLEWFTLQSGGRVASVMVQPWKETVNGWMTTAPSSLLP